MQKYTLIGYPLGHSMSPMIHERLFAAKNREASYDLTEISPEELSAKAQALKESAKQYGYDLSLYEAGNAGMVIGDFGEKARLLFESGRISEGHYYELMNMITNGGEGEDCSGC